MTRTVNRLESPEFNWELVREGGVLVEIAQELALSGGEVERYVLFSFDAATGLFDLAGSAAASLLGPIEKTDVRLRTDDAGNHWDSIERGSFVIPDPWGEMERTYEYRAILFDNGRATLRLEDLSDGSTQMFRSDAGDVAPWSFRYDMRDAEGNPVVSFTVSDEDVVMLTQFHQSETGPGRIALQQEFDIGDVADWTVIETSWYENGTPSSDYVLLDNGRETLTVYDMNGQVTRSQVRREDGRETTTTYEDGIRRAVEAVDHADVEDWERIERSYDAQGRLTRSEVWEDDGSYEREEFADGTLTLRSVLRDDGRQTTTTYEAGVRRAVEAVDTADVEDWARIDRRYDEEGRLWRSETWDDDGFYERRVFFEGKLTEWSRTDGGDSFEWERFFERYDEQGRMYYRLTDFDDGVVVTEDFLSDDFDFQANLFRRRGSIDRDDIYDWHSREERYDEVGEIVSDNSLMDDGRSILTQFTDGVRSSEKEVDHHGAYDWRSIDRTFDASGALVSEFVVLDADIWS